MIKFDHMTTEYAPDRLRDLALCALAHRVRPILDHESTVASTLFELEDQILQRSRALVLLEAAWETTGYEGVAPNDEKIFRRECQRRRAALHDLEEDKDRLLGHYANELLLARPQHPALRDLFI
ncbi:MAG: hypothetical protein KDB53_09885 [Planctomycetes bacterium]|nr:hypothetical protein [Planctomycetota bacterium]